MESRSLALAIFFALQLTLSDINISTLVIKQHKLVLAQQGLSFFHPSTFYPFVSLYLKGFFLGKQHSLGLAFYPIWQHLPFNGGV